MIFSLINSFLTNIFTLFSMNPKVSYFVLQCHCLSLFFSYPLRKQDGKRKVQKMTPLDSFLFHQISFISYLFNILARHKNILLRKKYDPFKKIIEIHNSQNGRLAIFKRVNFIFTK